MSSRFVSGGAIDSTAGDTVLIDPSASTKTSTSTSVSSSSKKSGEWAAVQSQLEAERRQRQQEREAAQHQGGAGSDNRSLYEILQANKAAKQAAFEEANKIKNQFRPLDDDEVEFLDEVRMKTREEEERLRRETEEGLRGFRERQRESGKGVGEGEEGEEAEAKGWAAGRKRKRRKEHEEGLIKGVRRRTSNGAGEVGQAGGAKPMAEDEKKAKAKTVDAVKETAGPGIEEHAKAAEGHKAAAAPPPPAKPKAGLVDYGSDNDSD